MCREEGESSAAVGQQERESVEGGRKGGWEQDLPRFVGQGKEFRIILSEMGATGEFETG